MAQGRQDTIAVAFRSAADRGPAGPLPLGRVSGTDRGKAVAQAGPGAGRQER